MDDERFFGSIQQGKWSVAAIISHIKEWDDFTVSDRMPFMKEGAQLERFPDFQSFNEQATIAAHNGQT